MPVNRTVADLNRQLVILEGKVRKAEKEKDILQRQAENRTVLKKQLQEKDKEISDLKAQTELKKQLQEKDKVISDLKSDIDKLKLKVEILKAKLQEKNNDFTNLSQQMEKNHREDQAYRKEARAFQQETREALGLLLQKQNQTVHNNIQFGDQQTVSTSTYPSKPKEDWKPVHL